MPSDFNKIIYALPKFSRRDYISYMRTLENILGFDSSDEAKFRFHVLEVYYQGGWKASKVAFLSYPEQLYTGGRRCMNLQVKD